MEMNDYNGAAHRRDALYTEPIRFRIAAPIRGRLEALARSNGRTLSEELRAALAEHVAEKQKG